MARTAALVSLLVLGSATAVAQNVFLDREALGGPTFDVTGTVVTQNGIDDVVWAMDGNFGEGAYVHRAFLNGNAYDFLNVNGIFLDPDLPVVNRPSGQWEATVFNSRIQRLLAAASGADTDVKKAGLQLAVWEYAYDEGYNLTVGSGGLEDGRFKILSADEEVITVARNYLNSMRGARPGEVAYYEHAFFSREPGDYIGASAGIVPEPGTMAVLGLGTLLMMRRRKKKAA